MNIIACLALPTAASALVIAVALQAAPAAETTQEVQTAALATMPEALFVRVCVDCHDAERTTSRRRTRAEWLDTIRQMVEDGAEASDEELDVIVEYLVSNYGAVASNTARAEDLVKVLGIARKDADAIVAFRTANGPFANLEAIRKVPEIDVSRLVQRKDSLRF